MAGIFGLFENRQQDGDKDRKDQTIVVDRHRCPENHPCPSIRICPTGALSQRGYAAPTVDMSKCIRCGKCVKYCPMRAISLQ